MSRVGRKPIPIPKGVEVQVEGNRVTVKGPRGSLSRSFPPDIAIALGGDQMVVSRPSDDPKHRALHGLVRSLLNNMVIGVSQGFEKSLEISGLGYRAQKAGDKLVLQVGFSHTVEYA
ncbi:MAG TPA: 50S ribosomal protein L6, partial [Dehalococcoidia bacterium]|nr:50S ribosomal protein L6 [Dehalococcoidia bacterium]